LQRVSRSLRGELDARIKMLTRTRAKLDECIGCGCLSLSDARYSTATTVPRSAAPARASC
jgi:hypothetical protein